MIREEDMGQGVAGPGTGAEAEARLLLAAAFETAPARPGPAAGWVREASPRGVASATGDLAGQVRRRAARQRRRRLLVPAGAVAVAAGIAGGVTAGAVTSGGATGTPDALRAVTTALVKTSAQSFTFTLTSSQEQAGGSGRQPAPVHVTGESDPANATGEEQVTSPGTPAIEFRFVGGYVYTTWGPPKLRHGKQWVRTLLPPPSGGASSAWGPASGFSGNEQLNPADLLALLKSATGARVEGPASGPGWTGTRYGFTAVLLAPHGGRLVSLMTGTVSVDSSGQVRQLVTVAKGPESVVTTDDMTFGGFGTPVSVTAPPASQVYDSGMKGVVYQIGY